MPTAPRFNMYNANAVTRYYELVGAGAYELYPTGDRYIVGISIQQSGTASDSWVKCNATIVAKNYAKDFPFNIVSYPCNGAINIEKTGQDSASFLVTTIPALKYNEATISSQVNFASPSAIALGNSMFLLWLALGIIILLQAITVGTYIFKK